MRSRPRRPSRPSAAHPTRRRGWLAVVTGLATALALAGPTSTSAAPREVAAPAPPPANATWDYQIGGAYKLPAGVRVVSRDREARPAPGAYSICYVNAYQTQPQEIRWWTQHHPRLLLRRPGGKLVVDGAWGEVLLDVRTKAKRHALARIVGRWIHRCGTDGFDAVEPDNLDSWTRSAGLMTRDQAFAYAQLLVNRAHRNGLAIAQKNAAGQVGRGVAVGFDFAVAEECGRWHECGRYARAYHDHVLVVEYRDQDFTAACARWGRRLSIIRRNLMVTAPGSPRYVYDAC